MDKLERRERRASFLIAAGAAASSRLIIADARFVRLKFPRGLGGRAGDPAGELASQRRGRERDSPSASRVGRPPRSPPSAGSAWRNHEGAAPRRPRTWRAALGGGTADAGGLEVDRGIVSREAAGPSGFRCNPGSGRRRRRDADGDRRQVAAGPRPGTRVLFAHDPRAELRRSRRVDRIAPQNVNL